MTHETENEELVAGGAEAANVEIPCPSCNGTGKVTAYGLYQKYLVTRIDGRNNREEEYLVLRVDAGAKNRAAALIAVKAYAAAIESILPEFAKDLRLRYVSDQPRVMKRYSDECRPEKEGFYWYFSTEYRDVFEPFPAYYDGDDRWSQDDGGYEILLSATHWLELEAPPVVPERGAE